MTLRRPSIEIPLLALLCLAAYAPSLSIPLIEDDYPNLQYARTHDSLTDPIFRARATSGWLMAGLWDEFGLTPAAYHLASLGLHFVCCCLLCGIVRLRWQGAFWVAAFFAVHEGHQEAVMWFSACNELLLFLFGAGSLWLWLLASREKAPRKRIALQAGSLTAFAFALLSKESAVVWIPLFAIAAAPEWRRAWRRLLPHAALACAALVSIWATRTYSFRFSDGSFSWSAPFWIAWCRGMVRMLWPWGWMALAAVAWFRVSKLTAVAWDALAWMSFALIPYSFLTYSTQIPSRQTYLAGAGLALLCGTALARLWAQPGAPRKLAAAAAAAILVVNLGYLWTKKRTQFQQRAEPTEQLIAMARGTAGPIWVRCFPRNQYIAEEAVHVAAGRPPDTLVWTEAEAKQRGATATFCYQEPRR